jgi:mannose-6-phosphate isomerase-like protein (cupin superfamily)
MYIKDIRDCRPIRAGDGSALREILNAGKGSFAFGYSLALAAVEAGGRTKPHRLRSSEVYYLLSGRGRMHVDGETSEVTAGQAVYIPPGALQFIENRGPGRLKFLCIVDPAWRPRDEEVPD